jgi:hypothetical protein
MAYRDDAGRVVDFHAFRHTFISNLAAGGVHPKTAQRLARHSTISLTMDRYTHQYGGELSAALSVLPDLTPAARTIRATGTADVRAVDAGNIQGGAYRGARCGALLYREKGDGRLQDGRKDSALANDESPCKIRENSVNPSGNTSVGLVAELADATDSKSVCHNENTPVNIEDSARPANRGARRGALLHRGMRGLDQDLQIVIDAWGRLPPAIRRAVMVMVEAAHE